MSNKQLPADVQEQIENKALEISNYDHHNERHLCPYDKGRYSGYISGASAWAIWKQRYDELKAQPQPVWVKASEFKTDRPIFRPYRKKSIHEGCDYDFGEVFVVVHEDERLYLDIDNEENYLPQSDELWNDLEILDESGTAANELEQELALSKEVNKEALALTEKAQLQLQDLRDKGDMLAIAARQLAFSMEVHSDYEPNSEFFDRVQGVWKAVAEWSGEKEVNVSWGGTQPATILVHCTDKSCPYCHGTGKVKIESQTTGRISYADHYSNGSISFSTEKEVKGEGK